MGYLNSCSNCGKELDYVPQPGLKCPYCGYSPPLLMQFVVGVGLMGLIILVFYLLKKIF